jgi:S-adenosylmethionine synthetase
MTSKDVRKIVEPIIREALGDLPVDKDCKWHVNPTASS